MVDADGSCGRTGGSSSKASRRWAEGERAKRWRLAERLLHENGLTYTADADAGAPSGRGISTSCRWCLAPTEWHALEQGLIQRARLLNTILADLYGPQKLLRDGHLPAAVVLGNPHFLRPCPRHPAARRPLPAALRRRPRPRPGRAMVGARPIAPQAPSGVGFALENRDRARRAACPSCSATATSTGSPTTSRPCTTAWSARTNRDEPAGSCC